LKQKPVTSVDDPILDELKSMRKLLIASLLLSGLDAKVIAKVLGYKRTSSISNKFPVRKIVECDTDRMRRLATMLQTAEAQGAISET